MKYVMLLCVVLLARTLCAADAPVKPADTDISAITVQLSSSAAEERASGIKAIREMIRTQPARASAPLRNTWGKLLLDGKEYAAADDIALQQILANAGDTYSIENALQLRIRANIAMGKADVALAHARSLYNVSSMSGTSSAMLLVAECLVAQSPNDARRLNQFRTEQMAGSKTLEATSASVYAAKPAHGSPLLASVQVDAKPYLEKAGSMYGEDYASLLSRGNLMLLADRPADAKELFERAYSTATDAQLVSATESLARCMKAQDGVIGRANTWLLSLRPREQRR